jgi:hypothetical protein
MDRRVDDEGIRRVGLERVLRICLIVRGTGGRKAVVSEETDVVGSGEKLKLVRSEKVKGLRRRVGVKHHLGEDLCRTNRCRRKAGGHNEFTTIEESLKIRVSISVNE